MVAQRSFKSLVVGSNPARPTISSNIASYKISLECFYVKAVKVRHVDF